MYFGRYCVARNGQRLSQRGGATDEITERIYTKESDTLRLSCHSTSARFDGDLFAGHSINFEREESW